MNALGIHLTRRGVRAVLVADDGTALSSASADGHDLPASFAEAVRQAAGGERFETVAVATDPSEPVDVAAAGRELSGDARFGHLRPVAAGAAAVAAEAWVGAAKGARHAICLWIGDDVLAGILLDGTPWAGAHGLAGSAAWLALNPVERQDYRKFGSLAAEVSSRGIARRLAWRIQAGDSSAVLERAGDLDAITATHVFEGARTGDGVSISVVRDTAKYIGMAISNLASAIDPDIVVIGGPVAGAGDLLLEAVRQECGRRLPPPMAEQFRCEMSPLGADGIPIGAVRLAPQARA
jgi:predicted NBD/HSP70 family sugar kinase